MLDEFLMREIKNVGDKDDLLFKAIMYLIAYSFNQRNGKKKLVKPRLNSTLEEAMDKRFQKIEAAIKASRPRLTPSPS